MALINRTFGWRTFGRTQRKRSANVHLGPVLLIIGGIIVLVALVQLVQTSNATTSNFSIQQLEKEKLELETRVGQLEADIGSLSALTRIEREATQRLGLIPPVDQRSVSVNVPAPAAELGLPTRFAPDEESAVDESSDSWLDSLTGLLPFD